MHIDWGWWARAARAPRPTRSVSFALVPALYLLAVLEAAGAHATLREYGRPTAEVALVVGLSIQTLETCTHGFGYIAAWKWWLSILFHLSLAPVYYNAAVTWWGLVVAACGRGFLAPLGGGCRSRHAPPERWYICDRRHRGVG